jgi:ribonuclease D
VAQALAAWRERRAAELDIPTRFVLPDLALVSMAQRPPRGRGDLDAVRGLDGRYTKGDAGAQLMGAVRRGLSMDDAELRLPPVEDLDRRLRAGVALVSAWIAQLASDLQIDATLLATRSDLNAFLRGDENAKLAHGWRAELVGEPVRRVVAGEAALAFDGRGGLLLEARSHLPPTA